MAEHGRSVGWMKERGYGAEFVEVSFGPRSLSAAGVAIGAEPVPYRVDFELHTGPEYVTTRLTATTRGQGWRRSLDLRRAEDGTWSATSERHGEAPFGPPGGEMAALDGALDCDLEMSPLTNSMPVLRHAMLEGGAASTFLMAWVALPALAVVPSRQRYVPLGTRGDDGGLVRYESVDGDFVADISFDPDGLVVDYPQLGHRLR
jgi:uncharacterized protein